MPSPSSLTAAEQYDLGHFDLQSMIECGRAIRQLGKLAASMEETAQQIVHYFYSNLIDADTGERNCVLVRCFKTHRCSQLPPLLLESISRQVKEKATLMEMPCLALLATVGDLPEWNDRSQSKGHAAVLLESVDMVRRVPMVSALLRQMGISIEEALYPPARLIIDADQHAFNVFHVENAVGDPSVPAQADFVQAYGIRSVLGFGGLLPSGELFAVIMFSRSTIPRQTADLFRTIALGVKLALLPFTHGPIFAAAADRAAIHLVAAAETQECVGETAEERLRSEAGTLRMLIPALEAAALQQTRRMETAFANLQKEEERRRQLGTRLSAMIEATTNPVFLLDCEWRFTFLNKHAEALIAEGRDLLGANIWDVLSGAAATPLWANYHKAMHERVPVDFEMYSAAPIDRWFEVHAFPIVEGIAVFFHDITGRIKSEAALRQSEKLAVTGRLAASIAHEINNPLEAMTNLLYLLVEDRSLSPAAKGLAVQAEAELRRVSEITTHMLRFHRQSTGPTAVSVAEVLDSVLVLFQGRLSQAGVEVDRRYRSARMIRSFSGELRQVFANLVGNALDACRHGCRIKVRVRDAHEPASMRPGIRVTIGDTGKGMSRDVQARLFEPFFTTKGATGTGLGLWVSLELIEKHGGTVRVRASEDPKHHGAVFAVFLPLVSAVAEEAAADGTSLASAAHLAG